MTNLSSRRRLLRWVVRSTELLFILLSCELCFAQTTRPITFTKDIAPIVYENCLECHRSGEVAPFPLINYADVKKHAEQIADVTASRFMPPWKAQAGDVHFKGERRLSDQQIKLFDDWLKSGATEGDAKDLPKPPEFSEGWRLGEPDLVVKIPKPFKIAGDGNKGRDVYRCFVIPLDLAEDKYVTAVEFRPSNRKIVHHALFFLDSSGVARSREASNTDGQPGYSTFGGPGFIPTGGLGGWAPGATPFPLPDGWAKMLRKGSDLVIQIHFHPSGKEESDQSTLGIHFAKKPPTRIAIGAAVRNREIDIAPGDDNYVVTASLKVPIDADLIGITPHAHLVCKDMEAIATLPDQKKITLIKIQDWDFNWQGQYRLEAPLTLPAGTVIDMKYIYDNSAKNIRNPNNPPQRVTFGEQTTNEMAILFLEWSPHNWADLAKMSKTRRGLRALLGGN